MHYLLIVLLSEVLDHRDCSADFSLLKLAGRGTHVKADAANLVGLVMAVAGHDDCSLKFIVDGLLNFLDGRGLVRVALPLFGESSGLLINKFEAIVNGQIF